MHAPILPHAPLGKAVFAAVFASLGYAFSAGAAPAGAAPAAPTPELSPDFFERKVLPILESQCYECHSHAKSTFKGGLALDSKSGWEKGGDTGPVIVPGDLAGSVLIQAVLRKGDTPMPPKRPLSQEHVAILSQWVQSGAPDPRTLSPEGSKGPLTDWWSLKPLTRPSLPKGTPQGTHPIDAFIRHALAARSLQPAPEADRRTLMRRVSIDLHGLPPTFEEVEAFAADPDPQAYPKLVDRLLQSPRYGERWGRHWLDVVRYGDSDGNEHDKFRSHSWRYRDYLIGVFNRDIPYAQFIREQLAADAIAPNNVALTAALGFLSAGPDVLGGDAVLLRDEYVTQTMSTFASSTVHCARCHNHKFDPISQEDYYALASVFAGVQRREVEIDSDPEVRKQRSRWNKLKIASTKPTPAKLLTDENKRFVHEWEQKARTQIPTWAPITPVSIATQSGISGQIREDATLFVGTNPADKDEYTVRFAAPPHPVRLIRIEALADPSDPASAPGNGSQGEFALSEVKLQSFPAAGSKPGPVSLTTSKAVSNIPSRQNDPNRARDNQDTSHWIGGSLQAGKPDTLVLELSREHTIEPGGHLEVCLKQLLAGSQTLRAFRVSTANVPLGTDTLLPEPVRQASLVAADARTPAQWMTLMGHSLPPLCDEQLKKLPKPEMHYIAAGSLPQEDPSVFPAKLPILRKGIATAPPLGVTGPGAMEQISNVAALSARMSETDAAAEPARRLWLANWLASKRNPLTWRSIVNRVWHYHFGRGLSDTPDDFGHMGGEPSHPELLDWLAAEFRDGSQSFKALHRLIVTSAAYRQSVAPNPAAEASDKDNRLLWRANRQRLDAESFRDTLLAVSGRLELTEGGEGVKQFVVRRGFNTTNQAFYDEFDWKAKGAGRRSVYRFIFRTRPDPFLAALNFPDASQFMPVRTSSSSPLQSLVLLNNPFVLDHCEALASHITETTTEPALQVAKAFQLVLLRNPLPQETPGFTQYLQKHGLPALCRVLINSNEFLFID